MKRDAELPVAASVASGLNLHNGTFQAAAFGENQVVAIEERLYQDGFHRITFLRRSGIQGSDQQCVYDAAWR